MGYGNATARGGDGMLLPSPSSGYSYGDQTSTWSFSPSSASSHSSGSLSSLLNPSSGVSGGYTTTAGAGAAAGAGGRPTPAAINTYGSYSSSSASMGLGGVRHGHHTGAATPVSPESRPTTGYSVSSMASLPTPYEDHHGHPHGFTHDYSRPGSSHHRPLTPSSSRPPSSKSYQSGAGTPNGQQGGLSVRRARRHSQAISPYPSPYGEHHHHPPPSAGSERPSTSPQPESHHHHAASGGLGRVRSMIQLPAVDNYSFNPSQADFAYGAVEDHHAHTHAHGHSGGMYTRSVRPSTSASSLSTSSSANTPGGDGYAPSSSGGAPGASGAGGTDADISRCE